MHKVRYLSGGGCGGGSRQVMAVRGRRQRQKYGEEGEIEMRLDGRWAMVEGKASHEWGVAMADASVGTRDPGTRFVSQCVYAATSTGQKLPKNEDKWGACLDASQEQNGMECN